MEYFLGWIVFSFIVAGIGSSRKIGGVASFFISLLLSPLIGIVVVLASKRTADEEREMQMLELQKRQFQQSSPPPVVVDLIADELIKLKKLAEDGTISWNDYEKQKYKLLNR